jgi:cell division protein FtsB
MSLGRTLKRRVRDVLPPLGFALLCGYFAYHSVHGDFGTEARERRLADIAQAKEILARATAEREALERRVNGMRAAQLDRDQLDERARGLLNLVARDELVIPYEPGRRLY